ncbi:hypothetical protein HQN87_00125 [Paenibacillus tritici]|uniref:Uncharacterized protein n=1 Tax=Paenibacillus tritici TaxID=1873425 RepID=A0ABX2DGX0_9BACL|nr:hypothetical protein [Paenibacillus tritici]NQX43720.1 hypothetical protein [Paenibacillus tritici]
MRKVILTAAICLVLGGGTWYGYTKADSSSSIHRLRLSDEEPARYLQGAEVLSLDQIELSLGDQSRPGDYISIPNHTEVLWRKAVPTPAGDGELIKFVQGGSAVFPAPEVTYYWLCYQRPGKSADVNTVTYYIEAKVLGEDEAAAKKELLKLAEQWEIPG